MNESSNELVFERGRVEMKRYQPTLETDANGYRNMYMSEQPVGNHYAVEEVHALLRAVAEEVRKMEHEMECEAFEFDADDSECNCSRGRALALLEGK